MNTSVKNHSPGYFIGYIVAMLSAFLLLACGGGGGSAGTVNGNQSTTPSQTVASLVITTSSDTLSSSGAPGTEVIVTVLARDKNNTAVTGATISLGANSGAVTWIVPSSGSGTSTATPGVTDATGTVMAKLSTAGAATPRVIALVATSGSATSGVKNVNVVQANAVLKIVTSSDELPSASTLTVTVFAKDSTNNVIRNAKILLSATSGILNVKTKDGLTDTDGTITATLTTPGDASQRDITITATLDPSAGLSDPDKKVVKVVTAVPTLQITSSGGNLPSSGLPGSEVTINVLVRDGGNNVKPNEPITLTTDSGVLSVTSRVSSKEGLVSEKLSVADDPTNRVITVTASANGVAPVKTVINVSGTHIDVSATASVNAGSPSTMTATLADSSGTPLANRRLAVTTTNGGTVQLSNSGDTATNGTVTIRYTPPASGTNDTIIVSALGATGQATVVINRANFSVIPPAGTGVIGTCYPITVHSDDSNSPTQGTVNLAISRGGIFSDSNCATAQTAPLSFDNTGNAKAFFKSTTPGTLTMTATLPNNIAVQGAFDVTAPLTDTANITLNVDPSVVSFGQQTTIRAVVRDGTAGNNLVAGATVNFNILQDNSGGRLAVPTVGITNKDGLAMVTYIGGNTATATNGVIVQGKIQGTNIAGTVPLTVGGKTLFLTAGTGNAIKAFGDQGYQLDYQVLATDAAGNAVSGANITASVVPAQYRKGIMTFSAGFWKPTSSAVFCNNEDKNNNGILDANEDATTDGNGNGNGRLDPGIPIAVTPTVQTDSRGVATVSLIYARNQSFWLQANLSITAVVAGSETKYVASFLVPGASGDFNKQDVIPPGVISPYGQGSLGGVGPILCTDPN